MKILTINKFYWNKGGSESVFFGEKALLESEGHEVVPFSMKDERNLDNEYSEYFVENIDFATTGKAAQLKTAMNIIYSVEARRKMGRLLEVFLPDVAHFHIFQHQISPSVFGPLRKKNVPIVLTLHDLKPLCPNYKMYTNSRICEACKGRQFYNCFVNKCTKGSRVKSLVNTVEMYFHYMMGYYQKVDRYIAVSKFYRDKMVEFGFHPEKVAYLPNYIDEDQFDRPFDDRNYGLYFGRISHEKGVDTLIEAASLVPDVPIFIAGTGPSEQELRAIVKDRRLDNIKFLGFVIGDDLKDLVASASFTVIPSVWYENCPMSVIESLALRTPVIGADIGGIPELIDHGSDGYTYEPGNHVELAHAIQDIMQDPETRRSMGDYGRSKIVMRFNRDQHYKQLISLYKELVIS